MTKEKHSAFHVCLNEKQNKNRIKIKKKNIGSNESDVGYSVQKRLVCKSCWKEHSIKKLVEFEK